MAAPQKPEDAPKVDFREIARERAERARALLQAGDDPSMVYAALELRKALEALVYEIAQGFAEDLPPDRAAWQPPRLLQRLVDIDPAAELTLTLAIQDPRKDGDTEGKWHHLGQDSRLKLKEIKENYDALGAYLHVPTLQQFQRNRTPPLSRLRPRCDRLTSRIDETLASTMWNFNFRRTSTIKCRRCSAIMRRRVSRLGPGPGVRADHLIIECYNCPASYRVVGDGKNIQWYPEILEVTCRHEGCGAPIELWRRDISYGDRIRCSACTGLNRFDVLFSAEGLPEANPGAIHYDRDISGR